MEIFLLWLVCPIACLAIANSKQRSGCGWALIGLIFGPLGLLAVAMISPDRAAQESRKVRAGLQSGSLRRCPACAEAVQANANICRYCGTALNR